MLSIDLRHRRPSRNFDRIALEGESAFDVLLPVGFVGEEDSGEIRLELWPPHPFGAGEVRLECDGEFTPWQQAETMTAYSLQLAIAAAFPGVVAVEGGSGGLLVMSAHPVALEFRSPDMDVTRFVEDAGVGMYRVPLLVSEFARAEGYAIDPAEMTMDIIEAGDAETAQTEELRLSRNPDAGFFRLALGEDETPRLFWDASLFEIRAALAAAGISGVEVAHAGNGGYLFSRTAPGVAEPLEVRAYLDGPSGFGGTIDLGAAARRLRAVRGPVESAMMTVAVNGSPVYRERVAVELQEGGSVADAGD